MNKLLITGLAALGLAVGSARAEHPLHKASCPGPGCEAPAPRMKVIYVEQEVTAYRIEVREREVPLTGPVLTFREVGEVKREILLPVFAEEIAVRTVPVPVPRKVTREVEECHWVSECVTDPCTGCTYTCSKPVIAVRTDIVTV